MLVGKHRGGTGHQHLTVTTEGEPPLKQSLTLAAGALSLAILPLAACKDDGGNETTTTSSTSTSSGGSGGTTSSGGGSGGTTSSGGGHGGTASGGGPPPPFWDADFVPDQLPTPDTGNHNPGADCMTCHNTGDYLRLFAGTIYQADGTTPAPSVEIGVRDGDTLRTTYSATNGNFWFSDDGGTIDWMTAIVQARNANGDVLMYSPGEAGCNSCHTVELPITEP